MFHLVLFEPEIPPNTGNIIRLCANTGCTLHLIEPLGFTLEAAQLRRAGLDYGDLAQVQVHGSLADCQAALAAARWFVVETGGGRWYDAVSYAPGDALLFGPETRGLPREVLARFPAEQRLSIPMRAGNRSLNLSNAVALVAYEAWRQQGFPGAGPCGEP